MKFASQKTEILVFLFRALTKLTVPHENQKMLTILRKISRVRDKITVVRGSLFGFDR